MHRPIPSVSPSARAVTTSITDADGNITPDCEMQLLAKDGIYVNPAPRAATMLRLGPGNRADAAVRCNAQGRYYFSAAGDLGPAAELPYDWVLATLDVGSPSGPPDAALVHFEPRRPAYLSDLLSSNNSVPLQDFNFSFHPGILTSRLEDHAFHNATPAGLQARGCAINGNRWPVGELVPITEVSCPEVSPGCPFLGQDTFPQKKTNTQLGTVQQWFIAGINFHPFHQHVFPFQLAAEIADSTGFFATGDWHDTIYGRIVTSPLADSGQESLFPEVSMDEGSIVVRYQVANFGGKTIIHCHFLDHEDMGCMGFYESKPVVTDIQALPAVNEPTPLVFPASQGGP